MLRERGNDIAYNTQDTQILNLPSLVLTELSRISSIKKKGRGPREMAPRVWPSPMTLKGNIARMAKGNFMMLSVKQSYSL